MKMTIFHASCRATPFRRDGRRMGSHYVARLRHLHRPAPRRGRAIISRVSGKRGAACFRLRADDEADGGHRCSFSPYYDDIVGGTTPSPPRRRRRAAALFSGRRLSARSQGRCQMIRSRRSAQQCRRFRRRAAMAIGLACPRRRKKPRHLRHYRRRRSYRAGAPRHGR